MSGRGRRTADSAPATGSNVGIGSVQTSNQHSDRFGFFDMGAPGRTCQFPLAGALCKGVYHSVSTRR